MPDTDLGPFVAKTFFHPASQPYVLPDGLTYSDLLPAHLALLSHFNKIFLDARHDFLTSLTPGQRALFSRCSSPEQLLQDVENFEAISRRKWRFEDSLQRVKKFSNCLQPYFETISIVLQNHPEIPAIFWGALRLILQVVVSLYMGMSFDADKARSWGAVLPAFSKSLLVRLNTLPNSSLITGRSRTS